MKKKMTVLGSFDDGSLDCKNVVLAHEEGADVYSGFNILKEILEEGEVYNGIVEEIKARMSKGLYHIDISRYCVYQGGVKILEIQWD